MPPADPASWHLEVRSALWPDPVPPRINESCALRLEGRGLAPGQSLQVEYLPPEAFLNGLETAADLAGLRVVSGTLTAATAQTAPEEHPGFDTAAQLRVQSLRGLEAFQALPARPAADLPLWHAFDGGHFHNIARLGEHVLLSWASDAYAGATLILWPQPEGVYALRCHDWQEGAFDRVFWGKTALPDALSLRLRARIAGLADGQWWHGKEI